MNRAEKESKVQEISSMIPAGSVLLLAKYKEVPHKDLETVRKSLRDENCSIRMVRNSIASVFAKNYGCDGLIPHMKEQNALLWGEDILALSRIAYKFHKEHENFVPCIAFQDNQIIESDKIKALASMPSIDELRYKLCMTLRSPVIKLASGLEANLRKMLLTIKAAKENQKD